MKKKEPASFHVSSLGVGEFAKQVQEWRLWMKFTRNQAAEALGVPRPTLDGWLVGRPPLHPQLLLKLMAALAALQKGGTLQ